jgi:hypothetical protein
MDITKLTAVVSILITLSVASERLVEIIKGFFPALNAENLEAPAEAWRKARISIIAIVSGIFTAWLSSPILKGLLKDLSELDTSNTGSYVFAILALGLLASGGSAFWNSILEYLLKIKDLKETKVKKENVAVDKARAMKELDVKKMEILNGMEIDKAYELKTLELGKAKEMLNLQPSPKIDKSETK